MNRLKGPALLLSIVTLAPRPDAMAQSFTDYFVPVDTVALSSDVLLGDIHTMDVDPDGRMLIIDRATWSVSLFEADGSYGTTLSVADCNPGFEMHPIGAYFNGDEIFMTNSGTWGYRFHRDGSCKAPVDDAFRPGRHSAAVPFADGAAGPLLVFGANPIEHGILEFDHTGKLVREFEKSSDFARFVYRTGISYVMVGGESVYLVRSFSPRTREYTRDGAFVREFGPMPHDFRQITEDIPDQRGDLAALMKTAGRVLAEFSTTYTAGMLDSETIAVTYASRPVRKEMLVAYDLEGNVVIPPVEEPESYLYYIGHGRVYTVDPSGVTEENAANPSIVVYERRKP